VKIASGSNMLLWRLTVTVDICICQRPMVDKQIIIIYGK
jgi:hypothetical protein